MKYRIRNGYVFLISKDRRLQEGAVAELTEAQIKGQEYKLEPADPEPVPEEKEVKEKNIPQSIVRDRMVKGTTDRSVQG